MQALDFLPHLRRELDALDACLDGDRQARVPSCPDWDLEALIGHVGHVHRFALKNLKAGPGAEMSDDREVPPTGDALTPWYRDGATKLYDTLVATDPTEHRPNFGGDPTSGFWFRRMAQEMAVHRWDAESALGDSAPIDTALAVDGIDEMLRLFLNFRDAASFGGTGETIHLHSTDAEGEWLLTLDPTEVRVETGHAKGDVAARGTASDLLLMLWGRRPPADVEVFGRAEVLEGYLANTRI